MSPSLRNEQFNMQTQSLILILFGTKAKGEIEMISKYHPHENSHGTKTVSARNVTPRTFFPWEAPQPVCLPERCSLQAWLSFAGPEGIWGPSCCCTTTHPPENLCSGMQQSASNPFTATETLLHKTGKTSQYQRAVFSVWCETFVSTET